MDLQAKANLHSHMTGRFIIVMMMMMMMMMNQFVCDSIITDPPNSKNETSSLIGYINGSLEIDCDVNASDWFVWTKDGKLLETGGRIRISREGKLVLKTLQQNDSGEYACIAGYNRTRGRNSSLLVVGKLRMPDLNVIHPSQFPPRSYTLPEWMTSVACIVLIAMITIIIIISYVKMSTPKKGDINIHSSEISETMETTEVVTMKKSADRRSDDEEGKTPNKGKVRQRKSSSTPNHDTYSTLNECLQQDNSSTRKKTGEKKKENERKKGFCKVEYVKETTENSDLRESIETNAVRNDKRFIASDVRGLLENFTRKSGDTGPDDKHSKLQQETKISTDSVDAKKQLNTEHFKVKQPPKKPIPQDLLSKTDPKTGHALRKIISDPCLIHSPPFLAVQLRKDCRGQGYETPNVQDLKKVSSKPFHRTDTIYSKPIIKGSLKLDKKSLKELKSKIQKSTVSANYISRGFEKTKGRRSIIKYDHKTVIDFSNKIYGNIEELKTPEDEPETTVYEESEMEPVYEIIQDEKQQSSVDTDERSESRREGSRKEEASSLQNIAAKRNYKKNEDKRGFPTASMKNYEPRKLEFQDSADAVFDLEQLSSPDADTVTHKEHEKCFENLSFSILEDLEDFDEDFDEEPNKAVVDRIYQDIERQVEYPIETRKLPQQSKEPDNFNQSPEESLYEEIHLDCTTTCKDKFEEVNELS